MADTIRASAIIIAVCLLITLIEQGSKAMAFITAAAAGSIVLVLAVNRGALVWRSMSEVVAASGIGTDKLMPVLKVLGISVCARMTAELCRDMGNRWAAGGIELFAVTASIICMLPLVYEVLRLVGSL